jgi:uncharacterized membrane protein YkoI
MKNMDRRQLVGALLALSTLAAAPLVQDAFADEKKGWRRNRDRDHDDAWRARQGGAILPLAKVLAMVRPKIRGEIIETEFEYEHGRPVYEFKYVDRRGRVRELYVDARTGAILKDEPD